MANNKISFLRVPGYRVKDFEENLNKKFDNVDKVVVAKTTAKSLINWCKLNDARFKVINNDELVAELTVNGCYRYYHFKNGMLHNDNGPAMITKYDGNVSEYYYLNGELSNKNSFYEKHIVNHSWELKGEKVLKVENKAPEVICY